MENLTSQRYFKKRNISVFFVKKEKNKKDKEEWRGIMCREVFQVVQTMDVSKLENRLALQCAPVITGIKLSNLLILSSEDEGKLRAILKKTGIISYRLLREKNKTTYLLFRKIPLCVYVNNKNIQKFLGEMGYRDFTLGKILCTFQYRYESYMRQRKDFPHEMGILLGYPIEDVQRFIEEKGKNYLYSGYWKVYQDVASKKKLFEQYENAKEELILWLEYGYKVQTMIQLFSNCDIME